MGNKRDCDYAAFASGSGDDMGKATLLSGFSSWLAALSTMERAV